MNLNKKAFTVIELILSFILVMFLALSLFALVNNYKNRQQKEGIKRELLSLYTTLTQDIYQDTIERKVENINYCLDSEGEIIKQCININFLDSTTKQLKIEQIKEQAEEDGTTFEFETFNILYGGVKYKNPDPKFAKVVSDYMLTSYTKEDYEIEYGKIYHIKIRIAHQDLEDEYVVDIVTTGIN